MGSEPDTDLLDQWGKFVPEIKTESDILIDPGFVEEVGIVLNNYNFNCLGARRRIRTG